MAIYNLLCIYTLRIALLPVPMYNILISPAPRVLRMRALAVAHCARGFFTNYYDSSYCDNFADFTGNYVFLTNADSFTLLL